VGMALLDRVGVQHVGVRGSYLSHLLLEGF